MASIPSLPPPPPERRLLGVGLRVVAATAFAAMALMLKTASGRGVSTAELIFYRNFWSLFIVAGWIATGPGWTAVRTQAPLAHVTRSLIGLVSMALTFGALALLPLGEATTLTYSAPIFATILSGLVLGETIGLRRWAAVLVGFVGVLVVVHPGGALPLLGIAVGIGAAFGQSAVMITLRQIGRTEGTAAIVFWFTILTTTTGALMLPFVGRWHDPATMAMLAVGGLCGGVAQLTMTASLRFAPVSVVVPFDYLQIIWATALGWLVLANPIEPTTIAGAGLIAASGIYTAWREGKAGKLPAQAMSAPEG